MEKMNPEVKAAWLEALRSGEYNQGHYELKRSDADGTGYCCLGVLCDISGLGEWDGLNRYDIDGSAVNSYLPRKVADWAGIDDLNPDVDGQYEGRLSYKNDGGYSFAEIADLIEKNF